MGTTRSATKRCYRLIPIVFITYSFAYLDRANFGFAAAGGMAEDLHISSGIFSLLASLFFRGYFFFQIPGAHYAAKKSAKKLIFWSMIFWGRAGCGHWFSEQRTDFDYHPVYAGRGRKRCHARIADIAQPLVLLDRNAPGPTRS